MSFHSRQTEEQQQCYVGYGQLSCYPTQGSIFVQGIYGRFIWNRDYPDFTNNGGNVDIYLFQQDSDELVSTWNSIENAQGRISFLPQDSWWQDRRQAQGFNGANVTWPFYFIITYAGAGLGGKLDRQPTWYAIQTALPASVSASRASTSLAASRSSASLASATQAASSTSGSSPIVTSAPVSGDQSMMVSSLSGSLASALESSFRAENATGTQTLHGTITTTLPNGDIVTVSAVVHANGQLIDQGNGGGLPGYAIALIVAFGLLSLLALIVGLYFCLRATRRRKARSNVSQVGSSAPIIEGCGDTVAAGMRRSGSGTSATATKGAETRINGGDFGLTSSEVWRLADAFRSVLRRPQFGSISRRHSLVDGMTDLDNAGVPNLTEVPDRYQSPTINELEEGPAAALLREELEGEGRQLRSVGDRKTPMLHQS